MKTRFTITIAIILLVHNLSLSQTKNVHRFTLDGYVKGMDSGFVYLYYVLNRKGVIDSCLVQKGKFIFKGNLFEPTIATFTAFADINNIRDYTNLTVFYIEPANLKLYAELHQFKKAKLTGSAVNNDLETLKKMKEPIGSRAMEKVCDSIDALYIIEKKSGNDSTRLSHLSFTKDSIFKKIISLYHQETIIDSFFVIQNPNSFIAADLLRGAATTGTIAFPSIEKLYLKLPLYLKESFVGKNIKQEIEKDKQLPIGSLATDFIYVSDKMDTINLSKYNGKKYVLLDFWASWCFPCRRITPLLKDLYNKYNKDLEIISIADEKDKRTDWIEAIINDKMDWSQVLDNSKLTTAKRISISDSYKVTSIPTLILIDKNSRIAAKFNGSYGTKPIQQLAGEVKRIIGN